MAQNSSIEWTTKTWNPIVGCDVLSSGCTNCYAMPTAWRLANMSATKSLYGNTIKKVNGNAVWTGEISLNSKALIQPLKWKKPQTIFVNSMGDIFHCNVPEHWIDQVFAVMALCPQHTFKILTKRPERMREYLTIKNKGGGLAARNRIAWDAVPKVLSDADIEWHGLGIKEGWRKRAIEAGTVWPLPNLHLGVSVETPDKKHRITELQKTPAALRFISAEPLLNDLGDLDLTGIKHLITGGETGPHSRLSHPAWIRSLRDQAAAATDVAFMFKGWGDWLPGTQITDQNYSKCQIKEDKTQGLHFYKIGKKHSGNLLYGKQYLEMPENQQR